MTSMDVNRLVAVELDQKTIGYGSAEVEHERQVAIHDLLDENSFVVVDKGGGPFSLTLSISENRLVFDIRDQENTPVTAFLLSLKPFKRIVKDYFLICESYFAAIKTSSPAQIEAIDMGRRGLHNEGTEILIDRLKGKIETDFDTARRLFTLISVLHWRG